MALVCKAFGDIITFTRASSATFVGSNGLIQSATTNTPRFDYDPVTLAAKGLLIEEQRTNLLTYSDDFTNASWSKNVGGTGVAPVVTADAAIAPDGTSTADLIVFDRGAGNTSTDSSTISKSLSGLTATASYTGTVYLKAATAGDVGKQLAIRNVAGGLYATITLTDSWQRAPRTETAGSTTGVFEITNRGTFTNANSVSAYVWGAQLEAGSFATSYIPTVASQVTRSADDALVNTLSPWYNATTGSVYAEFTPFEAGTNSESVWQFLIDSTNRRTVYLGTSNRLGMIETSGGVTQASILTANNSIVLSAINKSAICYAANDFAISANGQAVVTDTLGDVAVGINALKLGSGAGVTNYLNGWLRRFTYYPRRLSNAELQAITA